MNVAEMKILARTLVREHQFIDAHFIRFLNLAYREFARGFIIPRLNAGPAVTLPQISGETQRFMLPYDHSRVISFFDANNRSLDVLPSEDVRQYGEYNSLGSFVQFYEYTFASIAPLYDSAAVTVTLGISNRGVTATASSPIFTSAHVGEWLLPINRNSVAGSSNPEDCAYLISATAGTVAAPSATCTLARPFRGVLSDAGTVSDLTTGYFEIRPRNTPIIRIWGDPGSSNTATISAEYQRVPSKLANPEDVPEESRLCEAMVFKAIMLAGIVFKEPFLVKTSTEKISESLSVFQTTKDFDKNLIHNFISGNPMSRSHGMLAGRHLGGDLGRSSMRY